MSAQKRRSGGRVTPSKKAAASGRTGPKGRVPVAQEPKARRRAAEPVPETTEADAAVEEAPSRRRLGGLAVFGVFAGAQVFGFLAYVVANSATSYSFTVPPGVGASVGEAARQAAAGLPLDIAVPPPIWLTMLVQLPVWIFLGAVPLWLATKRGRGVVAELGLRMKAIDVPVGLAIGVASQLLMVPAVYWLIFTVIGDRDVSAEARQLTDRATDPLSVVLVLITVIIAAPLAEEIYFRGMAQRAFARRIRPQYAVLASAFFFAASHFQPLQFPALLIFGVILGYLALRTGRLGTAIWAHVGFNAVTAVTLLFGLG